MSDTENNDTERDGYRLMEDTLLMFTGLLDAQYAANRYAWAGYEHQREDAIEELRDVRDMIAETLERYEDTDTEQ